MFSWRLLEESCHNLIECNRDYTKQKQVQIHNLDLHLFRLLDCLYFIIFEKKNQDFIFLSKILIYLKFLLTIALWFDIIIRHNKCECAGIGRQARLRGVCQ